MPETDAPPLAEPLQRPDSSPSQQAAATPESASDGNEVTASLEKDEPKIIDGHLHADDESFAHFPQAVADVIAPQATIEVETSAPGQQEAVPSGSEASPSLSVESTNAISQPAEIEEAPDTAQTSDTTEESATAPVPETAADTVTDQQTPEADQPNQPEGASNGLTEQLDEQISKLEEEIAQLEEELIQAQTEFEEKAGKVGDLAAKKEELKQLTDDLSKVPPKLVDFIRSTAQEKKAA